MSDGRIDISPDELRALATALRTAAADSVDTSTLGPGYQPDPCVGHHRDGFREGWQSCCEAMERIADSQPAPSPRYPDRTDLGTWNEA